MKSFWIVMPMDNNSRYTNKWIGKKSVNNNNNNFVRNCVFLLCNVEKSR